MASLHLTATLAAQEGKILACVHCGLCLEACPTYVLTGDENDSPRGRIYLIRAVEEGRLASSSKAFEQHLDRCLGCRACEPVCPAGVEYGQLLEAGRAELFQSAAKRGLSYILLRLALRFVWLKPARLKLSFAVARGLRNARLPRLLVRSRLARIISKRFEFALALLDSSLPSFPQMRGDTSKLTRPNSQSGSSSNPPDPSFKTALLFKGCVTDGLFARVNRATARVLEVNGWTVNAPPGQVCCGALHAHAGDLDGARLLARRNIEAFTDVNDSQIVTNAGGCGAMLVSYAHLFADGSDEADRAHEFSARVRDLSQQLETIELRQGANIQAGKVTYDASCHLLNGQHVGEAPLKLLRAIPGLEFVHLEGSDRCCGGAGVYNLLERQLSEDILQDKLSHIRETGAEILATGNPGCHMQIGAGARLAGEALRVCHPVELLDESYRQKGFYERQ